MTTTHVRAYDRTSHDSDARLKHEEHHEKFRHYARRKTRKAGKFVGYEARKFGRWATGQKKSSEKKP